MNITDRPTKLNRQRGAALLVSLILLLLLTMMVGSAFTLSTTNQKAVFNMQEREEAVAAANAAIEETINNLIFNSQPAGTPIGDPLLVALNNDSSRTYSVRIRAPQCTGFRLAAATEASSVTLGTMSESRWDTLWDITADVLNDNGDTVTTVRSGVRVRLGNAAKDNYC